jgi:hypothetical protein
MYRSAFDGILQAQLKEGTGMSQSRRRRLKSINASRYDDTVFYMSLDEAKNFIAEKYDYLQERYERRNSRKPRPAKG